MSFKNKVITLPGFLEQLHKRIESKNNPDALTLCEIYLQKSLVDRFNEGVQTPNWNGCVNAGDFDEIYPLAAEILFVTASRNLSKRHPDTYEIADIVSVAFCEELNETFQCSGEEKYDPIPIKSIAELGVEAGIIKIEDDSVHLTPKGKETAQSVGREIKQGLN